MRTVYRFVSLVALASGVVAAQASITVYNSAQAVLETSASNMKYTADPYGSNLFHIWDERQGYTLTNALTVDAVTGGSYTNTSQVGTFSIGAGTRIDSQFLVFDPLNQASGTSTFTFGSQIIGVIVTSDLASGDRLFNSDYLRLASVPAGNVPGAHYGLRGLELNPDSFSFSGNTLTFNASAISPGDSIRVITAASSVPGPLAALPFALMAIKRRRRKA